MINSFLYFLIVFLFQRKQSSSKFNPENLTDSELRLHFVESEKSRLEYLLANETANISSLIPGLCLIYNNTYFLII